MNELKPCPYCGQRGEVSDVYWQSEHKTEWYVLCPGDCLSVKPCETEGEAVATWNEAVDAINAYRRTCTVTEHRYGTCGITRVTLLSCGHYAAVSHSGELNFCTTCGARVVGE